MIFKNLSILSVAIFVFTTNSFAQSEEEQRNKAVFNKLEFFLNTQQTDSIYAMAAPSFQEAISKENLSSSLTNLYALGKIKNSNVEKFSKGAALYRLSFESTDLGMVLSIDANMQYTGLLFQAIEAKQVNLKPKEEVLAKVETKNPLDFFVDSLARTYVQQQHAQSLAVAVIHKNKLNSFFYGETAPGNGTLPDGNTIYEIGSISKTMTASLLAELVNKGTIALDDSIAKFLPDSVAQNPDIQKITFKMLANHTSGLPRLPGNIGKMPKFKDADPYAIYDRKALFSYLKDAKLNREPETAYEYSNLGFGLLGELISIIYKKPFMQVMKEQLFTPLEMTASSDKIDPKNKNIAKPHDKTGKEVPFWNFQAMAGAGAIKTSMDDLLRYSIAQLKFPETDIQRAMAQTLQFTYFNPPNTDIGLAWHMNMIEDQIYFHHSGGTGGSSSFIALVPDEKSVVIVLSNSALSCESIGVKLVEKVLKTKD